MESVLYTAVALVLGWLGWRKRSDLASFFKTTFANLRTGAADGSSHTRNKSGPQRPHPRPSSPQATAGDLDETVVVHRGTFGSITCVSGSLLGQRFDIPGQGLSIGRDPKSDIVIDDSRVSARHAEIRPRQGDVLIVDADSTNGVFVNDFKNRVAGEAPLKPGDLFMLSPTDAAHFIYRK